MIIFDEEKYAIDIIQNGFKNKNIFKDVSVVARYLRYKGDDEKYIYKVLHDLCKSYKKNYNSINDDDIISRTLKHSVKSTLKTGKIINITENEFNFIKTENERIGKILFALLVIAKFYHSDDKEDYYVKVSDVDLFKLCGLNVTKAKRNDLMFYISSKGYTSPTINLSLKLNYVDDNSEVIHQMPVGEDMIIHLYSLLGKKAFNCENCDKLVLRTSNRAKYCKECSNNIHTEQIKKSVKRQREAKKIAKET